MSHWAADYIGIPWQNAGNDLSGFDCWGLVRHVQKQHYGRDLPLITTDADNLPQVRRCFKYHAELSRWQVVDTPIDGDCALTFRGGFADHVGVWLSVNGGGVLHALKGHGVLFSKAEVLHRLGWEKVIFYRFMGGV